MCGEGGAVVGGLSCRDRRADGEVDRESSRKKAENGGLG